MYSWWSSILNQTDANFYFVRWAEWMPWSYSPILNSALLSHLPGFSPASNLSGILSNMYIFGNFLQDDFCWTGGSFSFFNPSQHLSPYFELASQPRPWTGHTHPWFSQDHHKTSAFFKCRCTSQRFNRQKKMQNAWPALGHFHVQNGTVNCLAQSSRQSTR